MKKILLIISMVIIGLLLILGGIYLSDKNIINLFDKKEMKEENNDNKKQNHITTQTITFSEIDSENIKPSTEKKEIILDKEKATIERVIEIDSNGSYSIKFKLNDKFLENTPWDNEALYIIDDILIYSGDGSVGSDGPVINPPTSLFIVDKNGKTIKTIKTIDAEGTKITPNGKIEGYGIISINDNKILFSGDKLGLGGDFWYKGKNFEVCDKNAITKNNIPNNYILIADYELEYLGNNKFSDIKMIDKSAKTLEQFQQTDCNQ